MTFPSTLSQLVFGFWGKRPPATVEPLPLYDLLLPNGRSIRYRIKRNSKSKRLRLTVTPGRGLTVVAPKRLGIRSIQKMVLESREWIARHLPQEAPKEPRPASIVFPSVGETWNIDYRATSSRTVRTRESSPKTLSLKGAVDHEPLVHKALKKWCQCRGETILVAWLARLSHETGYRFSRALIRGQQTRWGSCSTQRVISLNYHLLFLKPELVRYVLIHELCHTVEMNHTRAFWTLVLEHDPEARNHRKELRNGFKFLPGWLLKE